MLTNPQKGTFWEASCLHVSILIWCRNYDGKLEISLINWLILWETLAFSSSYGEFIFNDHSHAKEHFPLIGGERCLGELKGYELCWKNWFECQLPAPSSLSDYGQSIVLFQMDNHVCKMGLILPHEVVVRIEHNNISEYIFWRLKHCMNISICSWWVERGIVFLRKVSFNAEKMTQVIS